MLRALIALLTAVITLCSAHAESPVVPPELEGWKNWVLRDQPSFHCPFQHNQTGKTCEWSRGLQLDVTETGGRFEYQLEVFSEDWVTLPGSTEQWPVEIRSNGQPLTVVEQDGRPTTRLVPGSHRISGQFNWPELPRTLSIPPRAGLVQLHIHQQPVPAPQYENASVLWLNRTSSTESTAQQDQLDLKVFRKLVDTNPSLIETRLQFEVSGQEREITTGPAVLDGFTLQQFHSDLPARIESNGNLRIQLKPGHWQVRLLTHRNQPLSELQFDPRNDHWPKQEIWAFEAKPNLRTVQVKGLPSIDPRQTAMPSEWQNLPTYLAEPQRTLTVEQQHRGDSALKADQLALRKTLWLNFSGKKFTVLDELSGSFHGARLEAATDYQLGRAEQGTTPLLITRLPNSEVAGVEIRDHQLALEAVSTLPHSGEQPTSGWQQTFTDIHHTLYLPPGWSLLHATDADSVHGSWLSKWSLWHIFLLLLIVAALARSFSWKLGVFALLTLLLTYHRSAAPLFIWLNFAALYALRPYIKAPLSKWFERYTIATLLLALLLLAPFMVEQVRLALYPQLERSHLGTASPAAPQAPATSRAEILSDEGMGERATANDLEEVVVRGIRASKTEQSADYLSTPKRLYASESSHVETDINRYDPNQKVQVGPGLPNWAWHQYQLRWSGPVIAAESHRLWLASPFWNRLGYALAAFTQLALLLIIVRYFYGDRWPRWRSKLSSRASIFLCLVIVGTSSIPTDVNAQSFPPEKLLDDLKSTLLEDPACLPQCMTLETVNIATTDAHLNISLRAHSAEDMAFPLPAGIGSWLPAQIEVNGAAAKWVQKLHGHLYVRLPQGRHQIVLRGPIHSNEQLDLDFRTNLHNVQIDAAGWDVSGLPTANQPSRAIQLRRRSKAQKESTQRLLPDPIAPFVRITRNLQLGLDWRLTTTVQRIAPQAGSIHIDVPLLSGEAPSSGDVTENRRMRVSLADTQRSFSWDSTLTQSDQIVLQATPNDAWVEIWQLNVTTHWHAEVTGIPSLANAGPGGTWVWMPWADESVTVDLAKPVAVEGRQLSIDSVNLRQNVGKRVRDTELTLTLRATQGTQYNFALPENAQFKRLLLNGSDTPVGRQQGELQIPIAPGEHTLQIDWSDQQGVGFYTPTPVLNLGGEVSNIRLSQQLPSDRWLLFVNGPPLGPAVLFWAMLIVVLCVAVALGRTQLTPLKTHQWVLLSLGIVTIDLYLLMIVAAWFITLQLRGKLQSLPQKQSFNLLQVALILFSLIALGALFASIPASLLSTPNMLLSGNGSYNLSLSWYQDLSEGLIPQGYAISLPIWYYRFAMLLWSIWLAFALMRWIPWAWQQMVAGGFWFRSPRERKPPRKAKTTPDESNSPTSE